MARLTMMTATALAELLARREASSVEMTSAHLDRIESLDRSINAFTAVFRQQALADAARADDERKRGQVRGPIHGLPMSIKESIDVAGLVATMGVPSRQGKVAERDGGLVQMLREAGAVILGRTNVSQYLLYHESRNPIFGQTSNPWSLAHTPGGSSGGEAAAIASGMSPAGVGTDIGGSIRVPAHFTGICGLKPTLDRWTNRGSNTSLVGQEAVRGQIGPMARTVADLVLLMTALDPVRMSEIDPRVPPIPFAHPDRVDVSALRVGMFTHDGVVTPARAIVRGVERAGEALRESGCHVERFTPPSAPDAIYKYFAAMSSDGGATIERGLAGGEIDDVLKSMRRIARMPHHVRLGVSKVMSLRGDKVAAGLVAAVGEKGVADFWRLTDWLRGYRFTFLHAMDRARLDAVVCPAHATPALPHGGSRDFVAAASSSMLFNALQFPAGVVPVTRVREDEATRTHPVGRLERHAVKVDQASAGLPVGVQVVARPWREDVTLAAMAAIERAVAGDGDVPTGPTPGEA